MNSNRIVIIVLCLAIPAAALGIIMLAVGLDHTYAPEKATVPQKSAQSTPRKNSLSPSDALRREQQEMDAAYKELDQRNQQQASDSRFIVATIVGIYLLCLVGAFASKIYLLIWVYKDATNRGHPGWSWLLFCLFFPFVGLIVYVFCRPQGHLAICQRCGQKGISYLLSCPHCGCRSEDDVHAAAAWTE